jgi:hypothetical protein
LQADWMVRSEDRDRDIGGSPNDVFHSNDRGTSRLISVEDLATVSTGTTATLMPKLSSRPALPT